MASWLFFVPPEIEWFANLGNKRMLRAYENALPLLEGAFCRAGLDGRSGSFRSVVVPAAL